MLRGAANEVVDPSGGSTCASSVGSVASIGGAGTADTTLEV